MRPSGRAVPVPVRQSVLPELLWGARLDDPMEARVEMGVTPENVQVVAKPHRRAFTAEYKRVEWCRARALEWPPI